jgi:ubiquinone/menaquinone biosynthesis C-methylase UbiE
MSADRINRHAAEGFQQGAAAYEASRPTYPPEVLDRLAAVGSLARGARVLDLAAGTGKLTRLLVDRDYDVVAVEPVEAMRGQLVAACPGVDALDGTAEAIPVGNGSFDAVTVAQAFHWFDAAAALAEIHRVLRPGGTLFLVWNTRDRSVDWVRAWGELLSDGQLERPYSSYYEHDYGAVVTAAAGGAFGPVERWTHWWEQPCDPELLVTRAASVSVVGALSEADRAVVLSQVRDLAATHPQLAGRATFPFPYTSLVYSCHAR